MTTEELMKECKEKGLDARQLNQVQQGLDFGLSKEEIRLYAKPCYDELQMNSIRLAIKHRLSEEEINFLADEKFNGHQMEQIVTGLKDGLTLEKVKSYALENLSAHAMCQKRIQLLKESVADNPSIFSKDYFDHMVRISEKQSQQMESMNANMKWIQAFMKDQMPEPIQVNNHKQRMAELKKELQATEEKIQKLTKENEELRKSEQEKKEFLRELIRKDGQKAGPIFVPFRRKKNPQTVIELMGNAKFDEKQLVQIRIGAEHGLSLSEILNYAKPGFDAGRMECIRSVLESRRKE